MLQRVMSQIASVKKDMIILEKSEFTSLLAENEVSVFIGRLKLFLQSITCIASVPLVVLIISMVPEFTFMCINGLLTKLHALAKNTEYI